MIKKYHYEYILVSNNLRDGFKQIATYKNYFDVRYHYCIYKYSNNYSCLEIHKKRVYN